jgi:hypothetical protein
MCGIKQKFTVHKNVKCQQDKPQYSEKESEDMTIVTEEKLCKHNEKYKKAVIFMYM